MNKKVLKNIAAVLSANLKLKDWKASTMTIRPLNCGQFQLFHSINVSLSLKEVSLTFDKTGK